MLDIGSKYGLLNVIEYLGFVNGRTSYLCRCDCGKERVTQARFLISGKVKSCGCLKLMMGSAHTGKEYKKYIGKKFDRLLVLEYNYDKIGSGAHLLCRCDCGTEKVICARRITTGQVKSCGCKLREMQRKQ